MHEAWLFLINVGVKCEINKEIKGEIIDDNGRVGNVSSFAVSYKP